MLTPATSPAFARPFGEHSLAHETANDLYATLCRRPWNDHIRGLLFDAMEDTLDPGLTLWAAFGRVQCELAKCPVEIRMDRRWDDLRYLFPEPWDSLRRRSAALLATHGPAWSAPLVEKLPKCPHCRVVRAPKGRQPREGMVYVSAGPDSHWEKCEECSGSGLAVSWSWGPVWPDVTVSCTLGQYLGERCGRCQGQVRIPAVGWIPPMDCDRCHDGYVGGLAAALPREWPVSFVLSDKQPRPLGTMPASVGWCRDGDGSEVQAYRLPPVLFDALPDATETTRAIDGVQWKLYPNDPKGREALTTATVLLSRRWAGLPAWPKGG